MRILSAVLLLLAAPTVPLFAERPWTIESTPDWKEAQASSAGTSIATGAVALAGTNEGQWTSKWHSWGEPVAEAEIVLDAQFDLFDNKTVEVLVKGSQQPFTDANRVPHDWYGRCMIAIIDENRWVMALRSGVNHISWDGGDAIHIITSTNEGRTWGKLNHWFDGSPIAGMPYDDGHAHSEPGLFKMPNGDLVLQFWRTAYTSGTKQLRSTDNGKTWSVDLDRLRIAGVEGAEGDRAIGTEDYFVDPENQKDVYMAFQYFHYNTQSGALLARSRDNGRSYTFLSWIGPLANDKEPESGAVFEPAIEYVGKRTIVAVLRHSSGNKYTWQTVSTDMGASFPPLVDISDQVSAGVTNGLWQRVRLYKESNPYFQHGNQLNYAQGEGRLWGFGLHSNGGDYTRKPVVYWSDDNARSWHGPQLLHGALQPGTDTGYGDLKRRVDGTFVGAAYYGNRDSTRADLEQYTFGGERVRFMIENDCNGDGVVDAKSSWREIYSGRSVFTETTLLCRRWRFRLQLSSPTPADSPLIRRLEITPK